MSEVKQPVAATAKGGWPSVVSVSNGNEAK